MRCSAALRPPRAFRRGTTLARTCWHELPDLRRRGLVEAPAAPLLDDPVPVRAVGPAGAVADRADTTGTYSAKVGAAGRLPGRPAGPRGTGPSAPARAAPRRPRPARVRLRGVRSGDRHRSPPSRAGNGTCAREGLVHHRERVRGQGVLGGDRGEQHPVAGEQPAAVPQRRGDRDVGPGRQGDQAGRVAAGDHHARLGGQGQPVPAAPAQRAGDRPVGDAAGAVDAAEPVHHVPAKRGRAARAGP